MTKINIGDTVYYIPTKQLCVVTDIRHKRTKHNNSWHQAYLCLLNGELITVRRYQLTKAKYQRGLSRAFKEYRERKIIS